MFNNRPYSSCILNREQAKVLLNLSDYKINRAEARRDGLLCIRQGIAYYLSMNAPYKTL